MSRGWESWDCTNRFEAKQIPEWGREGDLARLSLVVYTKGNKHRLKYKKFNHNLTHLTIRLFFSLRVVKKVSQRDCRHSILKDTQNPTGQPPGVHTALSKGVAIDDLWCSFQPQPLSGSVKLTNALVLWNSALCTVHLPNISAVLMIFMP